MRTLQQESKNGVPYELIELPNLLKQKVGSGGFDPAAVKKAEVAVEEMAEDYEARLQAEVAALDETFRAMRRDGVVEPRRLYAFAHELRCEAGSFGYPLASAIGNMLARFLDARGGELARADLEVIESHIDALRAVAGRKVKGDGGEVGLQLVEGLAALAARTLE